MTDLYQGNILSANELREDRDPGPDVAAPDPQALVGKLTRRARRLGRRMWRLENAPVRILTLMD